MGPRGRAPRFSAALRLKSSRSGGFRGGSVSTMVMTGGTSGFGAIAAERLTGSGNARLILGARRPTSVGESIPLDLTRLDSVRAFTTSVRERLGDTPVDALVLNAGTIRPDVTARTVDGFETTFTVNHLCAAGLRQAHDPATHAGLAPPRHADSELLVHPDRRPRLRSPAAQGGRARLHRVQAVHRTDRTVVVLAPRRPDTATHCRRLRLRTGVRHEIGQEPAVPLTDSLVTAGHVLGWPLRRLNRNLNSRAAAGNTLADLALGRAAASPNGRICAALRRGKLSWPDPSELARRDELAQALWNDSARLVGLSA